MFAQTISTAVLVIVLGLTAGSVVAQTPNGEAEMWQTFAARLDSGAAVEVRMKNGQKIRGTVLPGPPAALPIAWVDIDSIELRKGGMSPGTKTLLGLAIGAAIWTFLAVGIGGQ